MKCKIPSFVADFVQIDSWISDDGGTFKYSDHVRYGTHQPIQLLYSSKNNNNKKMLFT